MNPKSQVPVSIAPRRALPASIGASLLPAAVLSLAALASSLATAADLPVWVVQRSADAATTRHDGQVEALRQAQLAMQVAGSVLELNVRAGDSVRAGQVLLRVDARAAEQGAAASGAQVAAAQAQLDVAASELARKRQLADKKYISQAALEQAESQQRAAQAQVKALAAQAGAARTQTGLHVLRAPFAGVVAQLGVELGDMAMPGRPLVTLYDPAALRVTSHVPASELKAGAAGAKVWLSAADVWVTPARVQVLPVVDARSLTQEVRAELPAGTAAVPGQFARLQLASSQAASGASARVFVPASAVVRRAELTAVYVMGEGDRPQLRQVRPGPAQGGRIEILSGLDEGEHLITDPQAATRAVAGATTAGKR